jgi:hypothetical protein
MCVQHLHLVHTCDQNMTLFVVAENGLLDWLLHEAPLVDVQC